MQQRTRTDTLALIRERWIGDHELLAELINSVDDQAINDPDEKLRAFYRYLFAVEELDKQLGGS